MSCSTDGENAIDIRWLTGVVVRRFHRAIGIGIVFVRRAGAFMNTLDAVPASGCAVE